MENCNSLFKTILIFLANFLPSEIPLVRISLTTCALPRLLRLSHYRRREQQHSTSRSRCAFSTIIVGYTIQFESWLREKKNSPYCGDLIFFNVSRVENSIDGFLFVRYPNFESIPTFKKEKEVKIQSRFDSLGEKN